MLEQKKAYIFIGKSGSGKGTQAELLRKMLLEKNPNDKVIYEETGALFREFINEDTYTSDLANAIMRSGERQPSFLAVLMWGNMLLKTLTGGEHLIMDGTPRTLVEAYILETALSFYNFSPTFIYVNISDKEATRRLLARGREDDKKIEEIKKRLAWFEKDVIPALLYFRRHSTYKFVEINGEVAVEEVHKAILKELFS